MVIKSHRRFVTLWSGGLSFFKGCFSFSQKNPSTCHRSQWESFSLFPQSLDLSSVCFFAMTQSKKGSQSAVVSVIFIKYPKADREHFLVWFVFMFSWYILLYIQLYQYHTVYKTVYTRKKQQGSLQQIWKRGNSQKSTRNIWLWNKMAREQMKMTFKKSSHKCSSV